MSEAAEFTRTIQGAAIVAAGKGPASERARNARSHPGIRSESNDAVSSKPVRPPSRRKKSASTVSLIIPAKNEARNLGHVLDEVPRCVDEVILVDGRSSDSTTLMARSCYPDVRIITDPEIGKGNALRAGFQAAQGEIIVAMDADGSMSPREIPAFVYFLENGFDFVKGSRFIAGGGSLDITPFRRFGHRALLMLANHLLPVTLTDLCYGFFAFRRSYLEYLQLSSTGFEIETELTVRAVRAGMRIAEVPSLEMPRRSGQSSLRSVPDGYRVLQTLLREGRCAPDVPLRQAVSEEFAIL